MAEEWASTYVVTVPTEAAAREVADRLALRGHLLVTVRKVGHVTEVADSFWYGEPSGRAEFDGWWDVSSLMVGESWERAETAAVGSIARDFGGITIGPGGGRAETVLRGFTREGLVHELDRAQARHRRAAVHDAPVPDPAEYDPPPLRYAAREGGQDELRAAADVVVLRLGWEGIRADDIGADDVEPLLSELLNAALHQDTCYEWTASHVPVFAELAAHRRLTDYHRAWLLLHLLLIASVGRRQLAGGADHRHALGQPSVEQPEAVAAREAVAAQVPGLAQRWPVETELVQFMLAALAGAVGMSQPWLDAIAERYRGTARAEVAALIHALANGDPAAVTASIEALSRFGLVDRPSPYAAPEHRALVLLVELLFSEFQLAQSPESAERLPEPPAVTHEALGEDNAGLRLIWRAPEPGGMSGLLALAFSPDGTRLATAAGSAVRLWDPAAATVVATLRGHTDVVMAVAFSPDGTRVASASRDSSVRLWDVAGSGSSVLLEHVGMVHAVAYSSDGTRLASGDDATVVLWDPAATVVATLTGHTRAVRRLAFSPDGTRLVSTSSDGTARVWDVDGGQTLLTLTGHAGPVLGVAWSPDGGQLATAGEDKTVRVWRGDTGALVRTMTGHTGRAQSVAWSPDGSRLASVGHDRTGRLWDAATGNLLATLTGHTDWAWGVAWSPDGAMVATCSSDQSVRLWDPGDSALRTVLIGHRGHTDRVWTLDWSPDGTRLATGSSDRTVRVWRAGDGAALAVLSHAGPVSSVTFSPDGTRLATAGERSPVRVWDLGTATELLAIAYQEIWAVRWSPDGTRIAGGGHGIQVVPIWDAATGELRTVLKGHDLSATTVRWSPDGNRIATGGTDGTVRLWDPATGTTLAILGGHEEEPLTIAWSPDGTRLVTTCWSRRMRVWDAATGQIVATHRDHRLAGNDAAWSPDGARIATSSLDETVHIWDAVSGETLAVLGGHRGLDIKLAWSPDGTRLATVGDDKTVRLWDAAASAPSALALMSVNEPPKACRWSPDGRLLAVLGERSIYVIRAS